MDEADAALPKLSSEALGWQHIQAYRLANPVSWQLDLPPIKPAFYRRAPVESVQLSSRWNVLNAQPLRARQHHDHVSASGSHWEWKGEIEELHIFLDPQVMSAAVQELATAPCNCSTASDSPIWRS